MLNLLDPNAELPSPSSNTSHFWQVRGNASHPNPNLSHLCLSSRPTFTVIGEAPPQNTFFGEEDVAEAFLAPKTAQAHSKQHAQQRADKDTGKVEHQRRVKPWKASTP